MSGAGQPQAALFAQVARTVAVALAAFVFVTLTAAAGFILLPMAERSADDLAALIVLSAQTWVELPPATRQDFEDELAARHNLWLIPSADEELQEASHLFVYVTLLEASLARRTGGPVAVKATRWDEPWYWVEIPAGKHRLRVGFPRSRIGGDLSLPLIVALLAAFAASWIAARLLAGRIARPLERLSAATVAIGRGESSEPLPETGPRELARLAASFNRMAAEVRELLADRTTLLAGISHDLRTPLARMKVALEMLPAGSDPRLIGRLESDLDEMNRLIGTFLELARGLHREQTQEVDLAGLLGQLADGARERGAQVRLGECDRSVRAGAQSLRRVVSNLLENAVRYGGGQPVDIECEPHEGRLRIRVLDRGPGIPPEQMEAVFRPFYRLESSRSKATGGSGLGLAIARQLALANGWRITLHPRPGGGLEARLELPLEA